MNSVNVDLTPFERWMVEQQLGYIKTQGLKMVVHNLEVQGYWRVRNAVVTEYARQRMHSKVKRLLARD